MKDDIFKPMLATDADLTKLRFPLLASPKLDGVRAVVRGGVVYSRSNKPIPNKYVQELFSGYEHFDGELIVGLPHSKTVYRDTVSHVMSNDKRDFDVKFYVFDHVQDLGIPYLQRIKQLYASNDGRVKPHNKLHIHGFEALVDYEEQCLEVG